jgi:hypothetical protein
MKVTDKEWEEKAENFQERISKNPYKKDLTIYQRIVDMVKVGYFVLDVGCGEQYLKELLPMSIYTGIDPYPRNATTIKSKIEDVSTDNIYDTVFCIAALDNVQDVSKALNIFKCISKKNVVILTGIGIEPDKLHTHKITREMLTNVLGQPTQEVRMYGQVYLFEWRK